MSPSSRQDVLLAAFAVLSLLLHALLLYLLPADNLLVAPSVKKPVVVEMRPPQERPREIDLPAETVTEPRQKPAKRLAPRDQVVSRETAPKGDAPEDRQPSPPAAAQPPSAASVKPTLPGDQGAVSPAPLDLGLPQTTQQRLREGWARKYREDVQEGDAVWLDTEKDMLSSFFKRFRDNIYQVWNYPRVAAESGQSGVCLLKIVINQDGSVDAVEPLESSGYPTLDREAIAAVYRGASYGNLPSSYAKDQLTIMAYFQYRLSGNGVSRSITGR